MLHLLWIIHNPGFPPLMELWSNEILLWKSKITLLFHITFPFSHDSMVEGGGEIHDDNHNWHYSPLSLALAALIGLCGTQNLLSENAKITASNLH